MGHFGIWGLSLPALVPPFESPWFSLVLTSLEMLSGKTRGHKRPRANIIFCFVLQDVRGGSCAMADGCFYDEDKLAIQKIFTENFLDRYTKDKTPFPLFFHSAWFFNRPHRAEAFFKFIDSILALPDVYFVTSQELIKWMQDPQPLSVLQNSDFFGCDFSGKRPQRCDRRTKKSCTLSFRSDQRQWSSCQLDTCPNKYPWVNNLSGN